MSGTAQLGPFTIGGTVYRLTQAERVIVRRIYRGGANWGRREATPAADNLHRLHEAGR